MATSASTLRRHGSILPGGRGVVISALHPAARYGNSIFPSRVYDPDEVGRVIKDGHQSRKIGKFATKGARKGWPIFTLTLEERATCPRTCSAWSYCYGNNMQAAERITSGENLEAALGKELLALQRDHPAGFMLRLHILGDFYSVDYVRFWREALKRYPALHIFGFTARLPGSEIGDALWHLAGQDWSRFAVRFSGANLPARAAETLDSFGDSQSVPCPAQTGATDCCATCGLCWHSERSIAFLRN